MPTYNKKNDEDNNNTNDQQKGPSLGTYGNGWSKAGRDRYCEFMKEVNESRALWKGSFNERMKKFAIGWSLQEQKLRKKKYENTFDMTLEFNLPSHEAILQQANNNEVELLNQQLLASEDVIPI